MNYDELLAPAAKSMRPSGIRKFFDLAAEMPHCISLGVGEPDFKTPWTIRDAGIRSLEQGRTRYTANAGIKELRAEICRYLARRMELNYQPSEVLVTVGGSEAIDLTIRALVKPGDEVIIPAPYWVSYPEMVRMCGGIPVIVETTAENGWKLTAEQFEEAMTPRTKMVILTTPNNPTGSVYSEEELRALGEVALSEDILILADEIYEHLVYGDTKHVSIASLSPELYDLTITINGFSKFAAMTGWRMGYLTARRDIYAAIYKLYQQSVSCMSGFLQEGAVQAFRIPDEVEAMRQSYQRRRNAFVGRLNAIPGVHCQMPEGAFYAWVSFDVDMTSDEMCDYILDHAKVVGVSGAAYGMTQGCFLRFSFASDDAALSAAADRIEAAMRAYQQR